MYPDNNQINYSYFKKLFTFLAVYSVISKLLERFFTSYPLNRNMLGLEMFSTTILLQCVSSLLLSIPVFLALFSLYKKVREQSAGLQLFQKLAYVLVICHVVLPVVKAVLLRSGIASLSDTASTFSVAIAILTIAFPFMAPALCLFICGVTDENSRLKITAVFCFVVPAFIQAVIEITLLHYSSLLTPPPMFKTLGNFLWAVSTLSSLTTLTAPPVGYMVAARHMSKRHNKAALSEQ